MAGCLVLLIALGVPVFDVWLLFRIGDRIGGLQTVGLVLAATFVGLALARSQRDRALRAMQAQLQGGQLPAAAMADGPMLLLASVLFALPGFVTDALALLLLVPPVRRALFALAARGFLRAASQGRVNIKVFGGTFGAGGGFGAGSGFGPAGMPPGAAPGGGVGDSPPGAGGGAFEAAREIKELPPGSYRVRDPDGSP